MAHYLQIPSPASSGRVDFNSVYAMTGTQVNNLLNYFNTSTFLDDIKLLFNTPIDNVVSLRVFPFDIKANSNVSNAHEDTAIVIGNVQTNVFGYSMDSQTLKVLEAGYFVFPKMYSNFLDYAPFTSIEIYLPYIGFINIDPQLVLDKRTYIDYVADIATGKCTAFISVADKDTPDNKEIIMSCDGTIGHELQIGGGQGAEIARNMLKLGVGVTAGVVTAVATHGASAAVQAGEAGVKASSVAAGASILGSTAINAITAGQVHITKGGACQPTISAYAPQTPYAIITRPKTAIPLTYNYFYGKPSGKTAFLSNLTGFTIVDSIHMEGLTTATSDEVTEIETLLKQGVIL